MKVRPILFSEAMAAAIREGRKTQTRRIIRGLPADLTEVFYWSPDGGRSHEGWADPGCYFRTPRGLNSIRCPHGQPGDLLWVKEAHYLWGHWKKNGQTARGRQKWKFVATQHPGPRFPDTLGKIYPREFEVKAKTAVGWFKRPSIFMPRWASRLTLEILNVRVERLNDISEEDAKAEGCHQHPDYPEKYYVTWCEAFCEMWKRRNGPDSWEVNPWVWVISFKVVSDAR